MFLLLFLTIRKFTSINFLTLNIFSHSLNFTSLGKSILLKKLSSSLISFFTEKF